MSKTAVTRVTHSCHLIPIGGSTFLTYPWFSTRPGCYQGEPIAVGITITATPKHGVHENTFVLRSGPEAVYFTTSPIRAGKQAQPGSVDRGTGLAIVHGEG